MRHLIALLILSALLGLAGCGKFTPFPQHIYSSPSVPPSDYDPKTKPYTVMGKWYYPLRTADGYDEVGMASWYGRDFHGNKTANGQRYDMYGVSAAHKLLPLGTKVRVTNLENNRSVVLVINDRGPFVNGRIIDLSYGAARQLGSVEKGVVKVRITALGGSKPTPQVYADTNIKYYHVRVGAFSVRDNAERTYQKLKASGYSGAVINTVSRDGQKLHIVQAGSFTSRDKAEQVQSRLKDEFPSCYIVS